MGSQGALMISSYPSKPQPAPASLQQRTNAGDVEIGIFGAEKYFNMKLGDGDDANNDHAMRLPDHSHQMTPKRRGPPSVSSESSWNSHIALLRNLSRNRTHNNQHSGKGFLSGLNCSGSCKKGKSVHVNDNNRQGRSAHGNHKPGFQTTVSTTVRLSSTDGHLSPKLRIQSPRAKVQLLISDHKLSEVQVTQKDIAVKLEKRLSILTWDAIPNAPMLPAITRGSQIVEDIESDGSSDLFEIENLAGIDKSLFGMQETDEMSSCLDPYEPSEASIEWSVATASAADASVVSNYGVTRFAGNDRIRGSRLGPKEGLKNKTASILGCKSLKAVEVAEPAHRRNDRARP